jgi:hypothetical protein
VRLGGVESDREVQPLAAQPPTTHSDDWFADSANAGGLLAGGGEPLSVGAERDFGFFERLFELVDFLGERASLAADGAQVRRDGGRRRQGCQFALTAVELSAELGDCADAEFVHPALSSTLDHWGSTELREENREGIFASDRVAVLLQQGKPLAVMKGLGVARVREQDRDRGPPDGRATQNRLALRARALLGGARRCVTADVLSSEALDEQRALAELSELGVEVDDLCVKCPAPRQ